MKDAILVQNLRKSYGGNEVLRGVDLRVREGEFYALMGPNGSGKTTLTSIVASVRAPSGGSVLVHGVAPERARGILAYIPQENFSSTLLTGRENLMYFAGLLGYSGGEARRMVSEILDRMGLAKDADRRVSAYSGGMRKRLEMGTALFPSIKVFVLDEPTTGVDPAGRRGFLGVLEELRGEGKTVLMTTHIGADAEAASRVGLMDRGRIIAEGDPESLKRDSGLKNAVSLETSIKREGVAKVLSEFNGGEAPIETEAGYRILSDGAAEAIPAIVRALEGAGCRVTRIEAARPSLEDVFFSLTRRGTQEVEGGGAL